MMSNEEKLKYIKNRYLNKIFYDHRWLLVISDVSLYECNSTQVVFDLSSSGYGSGIMSESDILECEDKIKHELQTYFGRDLLAVFKYNFNVIFV